MSIESIPPSQDSEWNEEQLKIRQNIQARIIADEYERHKQDDKDEGVYIMEWINTNAASFEKVFKEAIKDDPELFSHFKDNPRKVTEMIEERLDRETEKKTI